MDESIEVMEEVVRFAMIRAVYNEKAVTATSRLVDGSTSYLRA
jgi:hypothetical protein